MAPTRPTATRTVPSVRELTVPVAVDVPAEAAVPDLVTNAARDTPDHVQLRRRRGDCWQDVTCRELLDEVRAVARGLVAAGVGAGDRVGIMSRTRAEWTIADLATWFAGAVPVPVYETSSAEQVAWVLGDSGAVGCFVESRAHAEPRGHGARPAPRAARGVGARRRRARRPDDGRRERRRRRRWWPVARRCAPTRWRRSSTRRGRPAARRAAMLTHRNLLAGTGNALAGLRRRVRRRQLDAAVPPAGARVRPRHRGRLPGVRGDSRHTRRTPRPCCPTSRSPGRRSSCRCRGCSRRCSTARRPRRRARVQGPRVRPGRGARDRVQPGAGHRGRPGLALRLQHARVRPVRVQPAARGAGRAHRHRRLRRCAAGRAAGPLLPRDRRDGAGGLRPHRDHRGRRRSTRRTHQRVGTVGRPIPGCRRADRRRRRGAAAAGRTSSSATGTTTRRRRPRSTPTAGSAPATWAGSTTTGT